MEKTTYADFLKTLDPKLSKTKRQAAINEWYDAMGLMRGVYDPKDEVPEGDDPKDGVESASEDTEDG